MISGLEPQNLARLSSNHSHQNSVDTLKEPSPSISATGDSSSPRLSYAPTRTRETNTASHGSLTPSNWTTDSASLNSGYSSASNSPYAGVNSSSASMLSDAETVMRENYELNKLLKDQGDQLRKVEQQNSRLWTFVYEQREMIIELQKDLDRAMADNRGQRGENLLSRKASTAIPLNSHSTQGAAVVPDVSAEASSIVNGLLNSKSHDDHLVSSPNVSEAQHDLGDGDDRRHSQGAILGGVNHLHQQSPISGVATTPGLVSGTTFSGAVPVSADPNMQLFSSASKRHSVMLSPIGMEASRQFSKNLTVSTTGNHFQSSPRGAADVTKTGHVSATSATSISQHQDAPNSNVDGVPNSQFLTPDSANTPTTPSSQVNSASTKDEQPFSSPVTSSALSTPSSAGPGNWSFSYPSIFKAGVSDNSGRSTKKSSLSVAINDADTPLLKDNSRGSSRYNRKSVAGTPSVPSTPSHPSNLANIRKASSVNNLELRRHSLKPESLIPNSRESGSSIDLRRESSNHSHLVKRSEQRRTTRNSISNHSEPTLSVATTKSARASTSTLLDAVAPKNEPFVCLSPNQLSSFQLRVACALIGKVGLALRTSKEDPIVILSVSSISSGKEHWQIMKSYTQLMELDTLIRPHLHQLSVPKLPDRSQFTGQAPVKVDMRKNVLNSYFSSLLSVPHLPLAAKSHIARFMSFDIVQMAPQYVSSRSGKINKHGFLTKKGRNFGGWKTKYFVLNGPYLNYFDRPDGDLAGTVVIAGARIGRQRVEEDTAEDEDKQFRHAFLIVEAKRDREVRHVFCAESDEERDAWIEALVGYMSFDISKTETDPHYMISSVSPWSVRSDLEEASDMHDIQSPNPDLISMPINGHKIQQSPTEWKNDTDTKPAVSRASRPDISPTIEARQVVKAVHTVPAPVGEDDAESLDKNRQIKSQRKKSFFGLRSKKTGSNLSSLSDGSEDTPASVSSTAGFIGSLISGPGRGSPNISSHAVTSIDEDVQAAKVFGSSLADNIALSSQDINGCIVPSVLYRTTEFLNAKSAYYEEGIFRINGSSSQIRMLVNRFDKEHDVDLLAVEGCDINTVCGLLKKWLIVLPDAILTQELDKDFKIAMEIKDETVKIARTRELLDQLPKENYDMLSVLCGFMSMILEHQELNKMNIKNLSIIFSQTLKMAPTVFVGFLSEYHLIFGGHSPNTTIEKFAETTLSDVPDQLITPSTSPTLDKHLSLDLS